ncbi:hypothetical protein Pcaca04_28320 [Pectobacterium carotovorum subsp. carotovorum]|nr:hypothetical protein Pcaca04_28320 [Pectobacterium carotovorum subsp. carotovorum]
MHAAYQTHVQQDALFFPALAPNAQWGFAPHVAAFHYEGAIRKGSECRKVRTPLARDKHDSPPEVRMFFRG